MSFSATLLFFLPAFTANAAPVVIKNIPCFKKWKVPISAEWFGENKTWRGLIGGIVVGEATMMVLFFALPPKTLPLADDIVTWLLAGFLLGFGALTGDMAESAIKRKLGKKPGDPLWFWDGTDYIFGALLFSSILYIPPVAHIAMLIIIAPLASLIANATAYFLGWKNVWH